MSVVNIHRRPGSTGSPVQDPDGSRVEISTGGALAVLGTGTQTPGPARGPASGAPALRLVREAGMASAEYAVALIAACAFAAVLLMTIKADGGGLIGKLIGAALKVIS